MWSAWQQYTRGKLRQQKISEFWLHAEPEVMQLYQDLCDGFYKHGIYSHFVVRDTKRRDIFVAAVRDRIVHQIIANYLGARYKKVFYTYSCAAQKRKGVSFARKYICESIKVLQYRGRVHYAKLDVKRYFSNVNHEILKRILHRRVCDEWMMKLCADVIDSFGESGYGLPLGNLTSQWFGNIYLHELDWYVKHTLKIKYYLRYNDDIILLSNSGDEIKCGVENILLFIHDQLELDIPSEKITVDSLPVPIDVLGLCTDGARWWVRKKTAKRANMRIKSIINSFQENLIESCTSYASISQLAIMDFDNLI